MTLDAATFRHYQDGLENRTRSHNRINSQEKSLEVQTNDAASEASKPADRLANIGVGKNITQYRYSNVC